MMCMSLCVLQVVRLLTGMDLCAVAVQTTIDRLFPDERNFDATLGGGSESQRQRPAEPVAEADSAGAGSAGVTAHNNAALDKVAEELNKKMVRPWHHVVDSEGAVCPTRLLLADAVTCEMCASR